MTREQNETIRIRVIQIAEKLRMDSSKDCFLGIGRILYSPSIGSIINLGSLGGNLFNIIPVIF